MLDRAAVEKACQNRSKDDPGVSFVAFFHQRRPRAFGELIDRLQGRLRRRLAGWLARDWIRLAPAGQVHATLIGMEARLEHGELVNRNAREGGSAGGADPGPMDLDGFAGYIRRLEWPIRLRFGGFAPADVNPYDPRPPFQRSFSIGRDGLIVAVGWPWRDGVIRPALLDFRKGAERSHIIHKYHRQEADRDNDAFLVLGAVTPRPWDDRGGPPGGFAEFVAALDRVQAEIREWLQAAPVELDLGREHACVVRYRSADLAGVAEPDILGCDAVTTQALRWLYRLGSVWDSPEVASDRT
jgi:hypothetical protein